MTRAPNHIGGGVLGSPLLEFRLPSINQCVEPANKFTMVRRANAGSRKVATLSLARFDGPASVRKSWDSKLLGKLAKERHLAIGGWTKEHPTARNTFQDMRRRFKMGSRIRTSFRATGSILRKLR